MPKCRQHGLANNIDGRTRAGRRARALRKDIIAAMGREPNTVENALIDRCLELDLVARQLSEKVASGRASEDEKRRSLWHARSFSDALRQLGLKSLEPKVEKPTPRQHAERLARKVA